MDEEPKPIIIASRPVKDYLLVILNEASKTDEMTLQFTDNNANTAEFILRLLRKGCGWRQVTRTRIPVELTTCKHKNIETAQCTNKSAGQGTCTEKIRSHCPKYSPRRGITMLVNRVLIEKVAQARGM